MKNKLMNTIFVKINNFYVYFNSEIIKNNTKILLNVLNNLSIKKKKNSCITKLTINTTFNQFKK